MTRHTIVGHEEWVAARKALLEKEKAFTRERDALSRLRRQLPWEKVEKAEEHENRAGVPRGDGDGDCQRKRKPRGVAHREPDPAVPAGAQMLGHDWRCAGQHSQRERAEHPEEVARQRARGDGFGADPSHHDDVGQHDGHVRQVGQRQGCCETNDGAGFARPGRQ